MTNTGKGVLLIMGITCFVTAIYEAVYRNGVGAGVFLAGVAAVLIVVFAYEENE